MKENVMIPKAFVLEFDDVGWDNGRDLRLQKKASRSGLPRYHALEDYQLLAELGKAADTTLNVALCLADWDKDNLLRGEVGITHDPYGWDRKSEIDLEKFSAYRDTMENSPYVDYSIHGLLHGLYGEDGTLIHEKEYFDYVDLENGEKKLILRSVEDFNRRLDLFFKIYDSWGFKKPIRVFISPCGLGYASHEELSLIAGELYKRGVRYWTNGGFYFKEPLKVINGVACVKKSSPEFCGKISALPWDAYDIDPSVLGDYTETTAGGCVFGMHWTNLLRYNPKKNFEQIEPWASYVDRQRDVFGLLVAKNIIEAINQFFYHLNAKLSFGEGYVDVDLTAIESERVDIHKNEFFVSFKNGITPTHCEGGEISLYEKRADFVTYKVTHSDFGVVRIYI